ncbi:hypothetical protein BZG36_03440 [Bifiguratus adelaidae]|uniref:Meiotic recombination protein DMC1 n=1 Tax=Bifiguratus adelaidae TaxID=1938954 RepID=A0A261XXZ2_9FUNG|nr:hypothetical protein BZG36_03440 [Bifiguratus adelaidae]
MAVEYAQRDQMVAEAEQLLEDDEELFYTEIDDLQNHGIGAADINKLKSAGICTIRGVQMTTRKNLCKIKGLSEAKIDKIKEAAGKIQAMQLPPSMGGSSSKAAFIDTEGTFRPDRIRAIAKRFQIDEDAALENILVARAWNSDHQMDLITEVAARFAEEKGIYRLLVIDSIIALFRTDYSGRGELAERQQKLNAMLNRLSKIAEEYNVAVYITNQVSSDPGGGLTFVADPKKPVGGHILAHASTTRLSLRKGRGEERIAKVYDSPDMPEAEATYAIATGGITDASG